MFIVVCFRSVSEGCLEAFVGGNEARADQDIFIESSELIVSNKPEASMLMVAIPPVRNNMLIDALSSAGNSV